MIAERVALYEKGAITAHHLAVDCLSTLDPREPGLVLDALPPEVLDEILKFAREYQPGRMVTNYGILPATDQVPAAASWITRRRALAAEPR